MIDNNYIPDCIFPTDNVLEIPQLRLDMQAEFVELPFLSFGEQTRTYQMGGRGTLSFYVDDYRFNSVFEHPEKILKHNPRNIVEPNFSLFSETPIAFGMQAIYKKRFIARAMQERGIGVFVDLNVNSKFYKLNMLGVPRGWQAFCTRGYSDRLHYLEFEYNIGKEYAEGKPLLFVIYGGGDLCREFAREHSCVYISPMINIKKKIKAVEKIAETVAFFGQEIDTSTLLEGKQNEIKDLQIEDFSKDKRITHDANCS